MNIRPLSAAVIDTLEGRRLLAPLVINGTPGSDNLKVSVNETQILVLLNGVATAYDDAAYDAISIVGGNGADWIVLDANGNNPTTIDPGAGADSVKLGATIHYLDTITAPVTTNSSDGIDSLLLDDGANDIADQYNVFANGSITRGAFGGIVQTGYADVSIDAGPHQDLFRVFDTPATGTYRLLGGADSDAFDVLTTSGANVVIEGGQDFDLLVVNRDGGAAATVSFESNQDLDSINLYEGGTIAMKGMAGLYVSETTSSLDGDITLERGFIVERDSQSVSGLQYYRDRIRNGPGVPTAGVPRLSSPFATASAISDAIGYGYAQDIVPTSVGGFELEEGDLVVRYTLSGDADLDQSSDFDDLLRLAANFGTSGKVWAQGDFDSDGAVDFDDLLLLARTFNQSVAPPAAATTATLATARRRVVSDVL